MTSPWQINSAVASHRVGEWIRDAVCAQVDYIDFFPEKGGSATPAKQICKMCPVVEECGEYAITSPVFLLGVWGGMSENERRTLRRQPVDEPLFVDCDPMCGTEAGDIRHRRAGEKSCARCRRAATDANQRRARARMNA